MLANIKERARRTGEKKGDDIGHECVNCGNVVAWRRTHAGGEGVTDRGVNARVRRKTEITGALHGTGARRRSFSVRTRSPLVRII